MPKKTGGNLLGAWAFIIGVILAIIFGLFTVSGFWLAWVLVVVGLIVGFLNVADAEVQPFLIAGAILVIVSYFGGAVFTVAKLGWAGLSNILGNLLMVFVPATIIVALKSVFSMSRA
jgi:hypothetical protein